ncbi:MAG TPA: hypothetical protein VMW30_03390 [Candidatus Paceibacterota bacterium]|nr:hypothetical protein [Candidatus Paceibacterota bacterium]
MQDEGGNEHGILNQHVLIEIGAAMALYGDNESAESFESIQGRCQIDVMYEWKQFGFLIKLNLGIDGFKRYDT